MRIGLVCPYPWNVPGGVQQHVRGLSEALLGSGHEVSVIAPLDDPDGMCATEAYAGDLYPGDSCAGHSCAGDSCVGHTYAGDTYAGDTCGGTYAGGTYGCVTCGGGPYAGEQLAAEDALPPYLVPAGGTVPVPYNGSVARLSFGPRAGSRVRRWLRAGRFDVVHVHEPTAPSLSLLACWLSESPLVATVHTSLGRSRALAAGYPVLQGALGKIAGRIAVSEAARETVREYLRGDSVLIPNGVATGHFAVGEPLPGWPGAGGALGFLGRLDERRKGLPVLLEAFRLLAPARPRLRLLLAGPGGEEACHRLPPGLRRRVVRTGRVNERDKARAFHSVTAFVAPNLGGESFGIVLAEAMAAGAPIIASDIPAFRDVLRGGRAGVLFDPGDSSALANSAAGLLDDPFRRAVLSERARTAVRGYDWSAVAREVIRVYQTVALPTTGAVADA